MQKEWKEIPYYWYPLPNLGLTTDPRGCVPSAEAVQEPVAWPLFLNSHFPKLYNRFWSWGDCLEFVPGLCRVRSAWPCASREAVMFPSSCAVCQLAAEMQSQTVPATAPWLEVTSSDALIAALFCSLWPVLEGVTMHSAVCKILLQTNESSSNT